MKFIKSLAVLVLVFSLSVVAQEEVPRVGHENVEPPKFTHRVAPKYPDRAIKIKLEGYVILEAVMGKDGEIRDVVVLRGLGKGKFGFEENAIEALKQWEFVPGTVNGKPADVRMTLKIDFVLDGSNRLQLLSWDAAPGEGMARPPRISSEEEIDTAKGTPVFRFPVNVELDATGNVLALDYDRNLLNTFAYPETIQTEIDKLLDSLIFETATRNDVSVASSASFMLNIPLN